MRTIDRIHRLLLDAGIPERQIRKELAKCCGISVQAVGDWYTGKTRRISPDYIAAIAHKWGSNSDYLIAGKGFGDPETDDPELDLLIREARAEYPTDLKAILKILSKEKNE